MPATPTIQRLQFRSHDTRRNLPAASSRKRGESNFLRAFEKVWLEQESRTTARPRRYAAGREFGLEGFGRADLVFVAWHQEAGEDFTALSYKPPHEITAIEAKISDWRKGLMQAARYRHFAHRSILLLPPSVAKVAAEYLETFRALQVGLWAFDTGTGRLRKYFTPRHGRPHNARAHEKAVQLIAAGL